MKREQELLESHRGEYAWVLPGEVRAIRSTREELCRVLVEQKSQGRGIALKIEERQVPEIELPSPEVRFGRQ